MPRKTDTIPINNENLDRRVKLTQVQKQEIKLNVLGLSSRKLAEMYGVSKRTIQFILDPEKLAENKKKREERGGSKHYYNKEKHTEAIRRHRDYKKWLNERGELFVD